MTEQRNDDEESQQGSHRCLWEQEEEETPHLIYAPLKSYHRGPIFPRGKDHERIIRRAQSLRLVCREGAGAYPPRNIGIALGSQENGGDRTARLGIPF